MPLLSLLVALPTIAGEDNDRTFRIRKNLDLFNGVMRELDLFYVDTIDYDKLTRNSIDYMLHKLDPYTVFMPEEKSEDIDMMTKGEYGGIGALIMKNGDEVCISEPYEGMPSQVNGLKAGDVIIEVDGKSTKGRSVSDVSSMLRGTPGTKISVKVKRPGGKGFIEKTFLREKIQLHPIAYSEVMEGNTGYVLLNDFTEKAALEFKTAVNEMVKQHGITSLVVDLRNNGGGLIDEAVKIIGYFVPKGTEAVTTRGKGRQAERTYITPTEPIFPDMKLAILVNRVSASASEILAGTMQDLDRGIVVGERTFGKGLVQNIRPMGYGSFLKVTTAKYYIPSGRCIQAIDYSHRNDDGSVGRVPDSLTTEFSTRNGRTVRDGGGITPDTLTTRERTMNVAYYILMQNHYFNFATDYVLQHPTIAPADKFNLTDEDFENFKNYLENKQFTYTTETEKYFDELLEVSKFEGLDKRAAAEIETLRQKLVPDIEQNINDHKKDIIDLLSIEILKRYYYQKGEISYSLRDDHDLHVALELLHDDEQYRKILGDNEIAVR